LRGAVIDAVDSDRAVAGPLVCEVEFGVGAEYLAVHRDVAVERRFAARI